MWCEAGPEPDIGRCRDNFSEFPKFFLTARANQQYCNPVPPPLEGRFAIVTDVGGGMRWTQAAPKTRARLAEGEVVWS
jgi:hypothetical protein